MKKILLIGGAGYVGSVLTEDLLDKNFNVTVLDKLLYNNKNNSMRVVSIKCLFISKLAFVSL